MISYPTVRMYASADKARAVSSTLIADGFPQDLVTLVTQQSTPPANAPASAKSDDPILSSIMAGYVLKAHAKVYAEAIRRGQALVIVRPEFSSGARAEYLMDAAGPVETGISTDHERLPLWDDAAPFSSGLHVPVLASGAAPLSAFFVLPTITRKGGTLCSALGLGELADSDTYLFGAPKLSSSPAPLSSALKIPLLSR
jgi:hypothetical protein